MLYQAASHQSVQFRSEAPGKATSDLFVEGQLQMNGRYRIDVYREKTDKENIFWDQAKKISLLE